MSDMIITILRSSIGGRVKNNDQELKTKNKGATKYMFMLKATVKKVKKVTQKKQRTQPCSRKGLLPTFICKNYLHSYWRVFQYFSPDEFSAVLLCRCERALSRERALTWLKTKSSSSNSEPCELPTSFLSFSLYHRVLPHWIFTQKHRDNRKQSQTADSAPGPVLPPGEVR